MKKQILLRLLPLLLVLFFISCSNEDEMLDTNSTESLSSEKALVPISIPPILKLDLEISQIFNTISSTTTACGGIRPDISCQTGQRGFRAGVIVTNKGPASLPAGILKVQWGDITASSTSFQVQQIPHGVIPAGGTIIFRRSFYVGPCGCVPPYTNFQHLFTAFVDPFNTIVECDETNNQSSFRACDGC